MHTVSIVSYPRDKVNCCREERIFKKSMFSHHMSRKLLRTLRRNKPAQDLYKTHAIQEERNKFTQGKLTNKCKTGELVCECAFKFLL